MKSTMYLGKFLFSVLMVLVMLSMSSSSAMTAPYYGGENSLSQQGKNGDIENFREELIAHYDSLLALYPYVANATNPGLLERINQSKEWAKSLSEEELLAIKQVFDDNPSLFESPARLQNIFVQADSIQRSEFVVANSCPATLPDDWCGCPAGAPGGMTGVYEAKGVAQGFEFAHAFVPSDLVTVLAGAGGTVWAHPARIALRVFYELAKGAALTLEGLDAVNSACHQGVHEAFLVEHDELVQWKLDNTVELRTVQLKVIEIKEKSEFLINATESGKPVDGIEFLSIKYATIANSGKFIDITKSASVIMVEKGIYLVRLNGRSISGSPRVYTFEVKHTDDVDPAVDHFGFIMFDRLGVK